MEQALRLIPLLRRTTPFEKLFYFSLSLRLLCFHSYERTGDDPFGHDHFLNPCNVGNIALFISQRLVAIFAGDHEILFDLRRPHRGQ